MSNLCVLCGEPTRSEKDHPIPVRHEKCHAEFMVDLTRSKRMTEIFRKASELEDLDLTAGRPPSLRRNPV